MDSRSEMSLGEFVAPDRFAQRCLRAHRNGLNEILDLEDGFFCVPDQPEDDGVRRSQGRYRG